MIVNIYDVNHGFCGYVRDGLTGANVLIDCGYDGGRGFHPVDTILSVHGRQSQLVDATNRLNTSDAFIQPNVCRGRLLSWRATAFNSARV